MGERAGLVAKTPEVKQSNSNSRVRRTERLQSMNTPANRILFLQRTAGNQAVQRLLRSGALQAKLRIGQPGDVYEQEADRVAEQVMRMPEPGVQRQVEPEEEEEEEEGLQAKPLGNQIPPLVQVQRQEEPEEEETLQAKPLAEEITPLVQRQVEPEEEEEETLQTKQLANQITPLVQVQRQEEPEEEEEMLQAKPLAEEITQLVQRQVEPEEEEEELQAKATSGHLSEVNSNLESQIQSLKGGGQPLSENDRAFFEPRFGHDFSQVRLHTDTRAAESARAVNARAYTVGQDVVFKAGQYALESSTGQRLMAHELTHVVQQNAGKRRVAQIRRNRESSDTSETYGVHSSIKTVSGRENQVESPISPEMIQLSPLSDEVVQRAPKQSKWSLPLRAYSKKNLRIVWMVASPKAYLRTPPPRLKRLSRKLRLYTQVYQIDVKVIYGKRNRRKVYVKVEQVLPKGLGSPVVYGWTARSNLRMMGLPLRYRLSTKKRKGRKISFRKFANLVVKRATGKPASKWFSNFVYITFLGRVTKSPIHKDLALHLKTAEAALLAKYGGKHQDPTIVGTNLGLVYPPEPIKGARKSSTGSFFSMHFFGLAIDLDYSRNPYIVDKKNDEEATAKVLPRAGLLVDGLSHRFRPKLSISEILKLDKVLEKYFSYLGKRTELKKRLNYAKRHKIIFWKKKNLNQALSIIRDDLNWVSRVWSRSRQIIRAGGFTNLRKELIKGIGLYWGGDFGDMMHFDMRKKKGVYKKINIERKK